MKVLTQNHPIELNRIVAINLCSGIAYFIQV